MARQAKSTVMIEVGGVEKEFNPVLGFTVENLSKEKIAYLIQLGLKAKVAQAVKAVVGKMLPAVELNIKQRADMLAFGFDEKDPKVINMFKDKMMEIPSDVAVSEKDVFPKVLDVNAPETPSAATVTAPVENGPAVEPTKGEKAGKKGGKK